MIAYLKGTILQKQPHQVVVDVGGVGYCAAIPLTTYFELGEVGRPVELLIHTHLTDSALSLYGFKTSDERDLFLKLISVSGIGPKLAMNVLSGMNAVELVDAIQKSDIARITAIPGIGKKTALRIAMELQDKLEKKERLLAGRGSEEREDLVSALVNLGFRRKEAEGVVDATLRAHKDEPVEFEKLLRECLKKMARV
jgi:Holliday junction DNA helicase RuvA